MKALPINVYRTSGPDCTNGGISEMHNQLLLICDEGYIEIDENNPPANLVKISEHHCGFSTYKFIEPVVVFHSKGITTSTEFNGDMYFPDGEWAGHGQQVVDALKDIKTVDDYKQFVKAFNDEHFQYEEDLFYNPLIDGGSELTEEKLLDMAEGYYDKWFSDYLYFKNLRNEDVHLVTMNGDMLTVEPNGILVLNFGDYEPHCVEHSTGVTVGIPEKLIDICENLDWSVHISDGYAELEKYSPAGEDFIFTVPTVNFVKEVEEYARDFDADEHAEMWVDSRGTRGVPSSIRELIDDAEAIQEMLDELAEALRKGVEK